MKEHFIQLTSPQTQDVPKTTLQWHKLTLKLSVKNLSTKQLQDKQILTNVSGSARPGELLVIMGPSGAGKSTLLDCISGRNTAVQGVITANGVQWSNKPNHFSAYVKQDDMFYATITVREHLIYQARLRMGPHATTQQHDERVDTVLEELGLTKCRYTLIGGIRVRGISGGERKRLSFATEILTNPSLLFVDEPTSGLDSYMAEAVMIQLQQLAREGRTMVTTVHQPSSELFTLFDNLYLLCDGVTVYNGKADEAVTYFHDADFLNSVCTEVLHLENKKIVNYKGNYMFREMEKQKRKQMEKAWEKQQKQLRNLKASGKSSKKATEIVKKKREPGARSAKKKSLMPDDAADASAPMELLERPKEYIVQFSFPEMTVVSPPILEVREASFRYWATSALAS